MTPIQHGVWKEGFRKTPIFLSGSAKVAVFSENSKDYQSAVPVLNYIMPFIWNRVSKVKRSVLILDWEGTQVLAQPFMLTPRQQALLEHSSSTLNSCRQCAKVRPFPSCKESKGLKSVEYFDPQDQYATRKAGGTKTWITLGGIAHVSGCGTNTTSITSGTGDYTGQWTEAQSWQTLACLVRSSWQSVL